MCLFYILYEMLKGKRKLDYVLASWLKGCLCKKAKIYSTYASMQLVYLWKFVAMKSLCCLYFDCTDLFIYHFCVGLEQCGFPLPYNCSGVVWKWHDLHFAHLSSSYWVHQRYYIFEKFWTWYRAKTDSSFSSNYPVSHRIAADAANLNNRPDFQWTFSFIIP